MQCYPKRPDFELSRPKVFKMICIFSFFANCLRSNMMANNPTQHLGNYRIQIMFSNYGGSLVVHSIFCFFKVTHFLKIYESKNLCRQFCRHHPTFFCYSFLGQSVVVKRCDIFLVQSQDKLLLSSYVQQSYIYMYQAPLLLLMAIEMISSSSFLYI